MPGAKSSLSTAPGDLLTQRKVVPLRTLWNIDLQSIQHSLYSTKAINLWGTRASVSYQAEVRPAVDMNTFFPLIIEEDVIQSITSSAAAGPDMIKPGHLNKISTILAKLFNMLVLTDHYPERWKENQATGLPENQKTGPNAGKDGKDVKNWRPITIGSVDRLSRIFLAEGFEHQ